ncbi:MAG: hypothetical protein FJW86_12045 [Actinobacteria bacterium]|nr:hypothetical protein [Actinomycetota bacterium]
MAVQHSPLPLGGERSQPGMAPLARCCRRCGIIIGFGDRCDFCLRRPADHEDAPGQHLGRHHTEWIPTVEALIADGDLDAAEFLLWRLVEATEAEARVAQVPPLEQHFRRLGWIARQRGDEALATQLRKRSEKSKASVREAS